MPKGKKCEICNEGRMMRSYTRSYYKGYNFTEEHPEGIDNYPKGRFEPQGWMCNKCGIFIPDKDNYGIYGKWEDRQEYKKTLKENFRKIEWEFAEYEHKYVYTKNEMKREKKFLEKYYLSLYWKRAIMWYSARETRSYLRGLKDGRKISDKYWKEELEREKLTDEQILKKAHLIETRRKLGIKL